MIPIINPFVLNAYYGDEYFCDRKEETRELICRLTHGNHIVISGPRRIGKSNFISHVFAQPEISEVFTTIEVDIYSAKSLEDFVDILGKAIIKSLKSRGRKFVEGFAHYLKSLQSSMSFDINGMPTWSIGINPSSYTPETTIGEIFEYLEKNDRPCIVAIDEFQQISRFPNPETVEEMLRTYISKCKNALFIFAGSNKHLMSQIFFSPTRPFYQSTSSIPLPKLDPEVYAEFCMKLFLERGREVEKEAVEEVYRVTDGITANMQKIMNMLFSRTDFNGICRISDVKPAIDIILKNEQDLYTNLYDLFTTRQRQVLKAIAKEGIANSVQSSEFISKYKLGSPSIVQSTIKTLLEKNMVTQNSTSYSVTDFFFGLWLKRL